jgi:LacI family transcriptional regulator
MPVTIHDVASLAGVSIKTVSRVINEEPHVLKSTRVMVLDAMNQLGYSPNISAQRLASQRSFVIGLLSSGSGEYPSSILDPAIRLGLQKGYSTLVTFFTPFDEEARAGVLRLVTQKQVDGFILTPPCDNDTILLGKLLANQVPFVRLTPSDHSLVLPFVAADDWQGAYAMTEYLIGLGHRRIGFVYGDPDHQASQDRFGGYRTALEDCHVAFEQDLVQPGAFSFDKGILAGEHLLKRVPRPTAIFASNDESAAGVLISAHELGIQVPKELSVAGFDDFPISQRTWPPLSTVRQPMKEISNQALEVLIGLINHKEPECSQIKIPAELVIRKSTGIWNPSTQE